MLRCNTQLTHTGLKSYSEPIYPPKPEIVFDYFSDKGVAYIKYILSKSHNQSIGNPWILPYSFTLPNNIEQAKESIYLDYLFTTNRAAKISKDLFVVEPIDTTVSTLMTQTFELWEQYTNIKFVEVNEHPEIPPMRFLQFCWLDETIVNNSTCTGPGYIKGSYDSKNHFIKINRDFVSDCEKIGNPRVIKTIVHEVGHSLSLKHYFAYHMVNDVTDKVSHSIMNYKFEINDNKVVYPVSPLPVDILMVQHIFGPNNKTNLGDTVYNLKDFVTDSSNNYKIISSIWDAGGIDTLDASQITATDITINTRPFGRSDLADGYLVLPHIEIENVISSNQSNTIILNRLNNTVNITNSINSTIIIDPQQCGQDLIIGFNTENTRLIFESSPLSHPSQWKMYTSDCPKDQANCITQTQIYFDKANTVTLFSKNNNRLTTDNIYFIDTVNEFLCSLFSNYKPALKNEKSNFTNSIAEFPYTFYQDFFQALKHGLGVGFLIGLTAEQLRKYKFSDEETARITELITIFITAISSFPSTYSLYANAAAFLTGKAMKYYGFKPMTCSIASTIVANVAHGISDNPLNLPVKISANIAALVTSSSLLTFGFWVKNAASSYFSANTPKKPPSLDMV